MKHNILLALVLGWQCAAFAGQDRFVAHEWGTFTSVQGADGVQLEWNPFVPLELPKFVYGQPRVVNNRVIGLSKSDFIARQRMETPVIYFYSNTERTVDVTVNFPQGTVTEWYPQVQPPEKGSRSTRWADVRVLANVKASLPTEAQGSHYYAARETAANVLQVGSELEKFIFYRGVGSFVAPLRVTVGGNEDALHLHNGGTELLRHFYVLQIRKGMGKYEYFSEMNINGAREIKLEAGTGLSPLTDFQNRISEHMRGALEKEGLYAAEAASMVKTWRDSWFGEDGVRVLYVLPRKWTDRTLPLTIKPAPQEIARVMVGRAEVILPSQEWQLLKQIVRYSEAGPDQRPAIVDGLKALGMGRFADAATRRLLGNTASKEFNANAWSLVEAANAGHGAKSLAAR